MKWFSRKKAAPALYPPSEYEPVLQCSICTGEQTFCMRERASGKVHQLQMIRSPGELAEVCRKYGVKVEDIRKVY